MLDAPATNMRIYDEGEEEGDRAHGCRLYDACQEHRPLEEVCGDVGDNVECKYMERLGVRGPPCA